MTSAEPGLRARHIVAPGAEVPSPSLSLVVVVAEDLGLLERFVQTLARQDVDPAVLEVVVVDASGDTSGRARQLTAASTIRVFTLDPVALAEARAVGVAVARSANRLVVDLHLELAPGLLALLLEGRPLGEPADLAARLDLVRGLLALTEGDPDTLARRDQALAEHLAWINALLDDEPDRHAELVELARARRVRDLPWPEINRGRARDLALLYSFVPFIDTSGLVAARRLREAGVVTDVVSQAMAHIRTTDPLSLRIPAEVVDQHRILRGKRHLVRWQAIRKFSEDALAEVADLEAEKGPYRSVYSRAMIYHSHFAAALLKLRQPEIRWVAEFSDPLTFNAYGEERVADVEDDPILEELSDGFRARGFAVPTTRAAFAWAELIAYAFADEIIFTNAHQRDLMLGYCEDRTLAERAAGITRVLHHPVPGPDLYELTTASYRLDPDRAHLAFFGTFYANRGLGEVLDALASLAPEDRRRVALHVFTSKIVALEAAVAERGLEDVVHVNPMLGYLEYLNASRRFDVLLINDYATRPHFVPNPYLPAKLADYVGSGARIWSLYEEGSVLSEAPVDFASPLGDVAAASEVLARILAGRAADPVSGADPPPPAGTEPVSAADPTA